MIKKLHDNLNLKNISVSKWPSVRKSLLIILLHLGWITGMHGSIGPNEFDVALDGSTRLEAKTNSPKIIRSYNITDANTEDKSCFPTKGKGVIFQRAEDCQGYHHIWRVNDKLTMNEYDNGTATIVGLVIDDQGQIGHVNITLYDKQNQGNTWNDQCYVDGLSDPRLLYQSFSGTIKVGAISYSVEKKQTEKHFILADGAGFEPGQFGFGAWTGGTFGGCTEWFGNLTPIDVDCNLTVDAGDDIDACNLEETVLTANAKNASECSEVVYSYKIIDSNTEEGCFTADPGVIFQKGAGCQGIDYVWSAGEDLVLNEYADSTASITGSVIDQNGRVATVDILLSDKKNSGSTWNASCYLDGISGPETFYRSFVGAITVDGVAQSVGTRFNSHYILADGAGFDSNQYGLGAWTGGAFGECTEWFANLVPMEIENPTQEIEYLWSTGETTQSITITEAGEYTVTVSDCKGCMATDTVVVEVVNPTAYELTGGDSFCIDGEADFLTDDTIKVSGDITGANNTFVVTDSEGKILGMPATLNQVKEINFDGAGPGTCLVWHLAFEDGLKGAEMGANANDLDGCFSLSGPIEVVRNEGVTADAGDDVTVCAGDEIQLTATGGGTYLWSTGETTAEIKVSPTAKTTYTVTVTSEEGCEATDEVMVNVIDKVVIGDFVWLDENRNGVQDDGDTGVNDVKVTLFQCDGDEIATTMTADDTNGASGAYNFEVCPNSGEYYVVFGDIPEGMEFTSSNKGDDDGIDSDANEGGRTDCFEVAEEDDLTIDGGLVEICKIKIDAGEDVGICTGETIEITAQLLENTEECPSVCVYPIKDQERCSGALGNYEIFLFSTTGSIVDAKFKTSEQKLERYADNSARYTAKATNGIDVIEIDALFTGYTTETPTGSPKTNNCQEYDTTDWEYWTTWSGTVTSENHGVFNLSVKGASFQMGVGADVMRTGFGASGWFYAEGGDGFYVSGDVNVTVDPCVENGVTYKWTTEDGNIVGNANQKTIAVNEPGTYVVEALNCIDCFATDTITVTKGNCPNRRKAPVAPKMSTVYPVPVEAGGRLTIGFDIPNASDDGEFKVTSLKATAGFPDRTEDVTVMLYDMTGRVINVPRTYKIVNGRAIIYLELGHITSGKYILRAQGPNWSDAKNVLVK